MNTNRRELYGSCAYRPENHYPNLDWRSYFLGYKALAKTAKEMVIDQSLKDWFEKEAQRAAKSILEIDNEK